MHGEVINMECLKCHADVDKLYWHENTGKEEKACLSCLAKYIWDLRVSDNLEVDSENFYVMEDREIPIFIASLDKLVDIDEHSKVYRQRNSNNIIMTKESSISEYLECLDITVELFSS